MYNEVVAKSASRFEKMRKSIVLELNQDTEVLFCLKAFHLFLSYPPNPKRTSTSPTRAESWRERIYKNGTEVKIAKAVSEELLEPVAAHIIFR